VELVFHPHADSTWTPAPVERFLTDTTEHVALPGHRAHRLLRRDNLEIIRRSRADRLVTPQEVDPAVLTQVKEQVGVRPACARAMIDHGRVPDMPSLLDELGRLDVDLFAIVEQDLYPCDQDTPLPIAARTAQYLGGCGIGPVRTP